MNLNTGVRVMVVETGVTGNIKSVEGEGEACLVTFAPTGGGEDVTCPVGALRTLKGRPRKMA